MCSSWYHLRYLSPHYDQGPFDPTEYDYWMPVDAYTGGAEHAVMHLLYTRFFHKAGRDMGIMQGPEPMFQMRNQGHILGPDGARMSKSRGNVIDPDELVGQYGADTVRAYLMFGYRWAEGGPWNSENIQGIVRWLNRVWHLVLDTAGVKPGKQTDRDLERKVHQTIRKVTSDLETYEFNKVVSAMMELSNSLAEAREKGMAGSSVFVSAIDDLLVMMAPVTPHLSEELWARLGKPYSVHQQPWPEFDQELAREEEITMVVQVDGKVRDRIAIPAGAAESMVRELAEASQGVQKFLQDKDPKEVIFVPDRLINFVTK
jgi:leucyl-tRNA synthetase